ncbi:restriction endonuclease subunit S [Empedobacter falsenii]|uniref:methylation-associated defense system restriction endonuclease subunit S MAD5 n=1 Tax=Empedobacter falsenii TaxID=343874 RepID=UPI003A7FEFCB
MKVLNVNKSWIVDNSNRLDAKPYLSEGRIASIKVLKSPLGHEKLKDITFDIFNGPRFKRYYVEDPKKGVAFMGSSDMLKADLNNLKFISKKYSNNLEKLRLLEDWILVSCSGTIGNTVYTNADFKDKTASQHIMRIIPSDVKRAGYLYAYLSSKYGYNLLTQGTYGAVIQHIEPHHIEDLPVPILPEEKQQQIHQLIVDSANLRVEANKLLKEAVELMEFQLNDNIVTKCFQHQKISSKSFDYLHKRFDAQYQVMWKAIKDNYSDIEYKKIGDFAENIFVGNRGKRHYVNEGIPFLSSSDMMLFNPLRNSKQISKNSPGLESMKVQKKDILISRSGTVGNTVIVGDYLNNVAISEHALRLRIDSKLISPNYVFTYLKTKVGLKAMEASAFGSVIITLNEELIADIDLPILSKDIVQKIDNLIDNYLIKLDSSTDKENQAINLIENEIDAWQ